MATLVVTTLAAAGAATWATATTTTLGLFAFAFTAAGAVRAGKRVGFPLMGWVFLGGAALCLIQCLPLPPGLSAWLSPNVFEWRQFTLEPLGLSRWRPITLDEGSTRTALATALTGAAVVFSAAHLGRHADAQRRLLTLMAALGLVLSISSFAHRALGIEPFLGTVRFILYAAQGTPFGNGNHLAGFLTLSAAISSGLAVTSVEAPRKVIWFGATLAMAAATFLTHSRGGAAFFIGGQVIFAGVLLIRRKERVEAAWVLGLSVAVLAFAGLAAWETLSSRIESATRLQNTKVDLWPAFAQSALAFNPLGMGRGSFELGFARFQTRWLDTTFTHPENWVFQWACEWGLVPALALMGLAAWAARRCVKYQRVGTIELATLAGLAALVLHDLVDFSLEFGATASAAWVAVGLLCSPEVKDRAKFRPARLTGAGAALALFAVGALLTRGESFQAAQARLQAAANDGTPLPTLRPDALAAIDAHPFDHVLYSVMARATAVAEGPAEALAWTNRVLSLRPLDGPAHNSAGLSLLRMGRTSQAFLEFRLALEGGDRSFLEFALANARGVEALVQLVPPYPEWVAKVASRLEELGRRSEARGLLESTLESLPSAGRMETPLFVAAARLAAREGDFDAGYAHLGRLDDGDDGTATYLKGELQAAQGLDDDALKSFQAAFARSPQTWDYGWSLLSLHQKMGRHTRVRETVSRMLPFAPDTSRRAMLFAAEGQAYEAEGRTTRALQSYETASRLDPAREDYRVRIKALRAGKPQAVPNGAPP